MSKKRGVKTFDAGIIMSGLWHDVNVRVVKGDSWRNIYNLMKKKIKQIELYEESDWVKIRWE
jgi:hypothetical protein